MPNPNQSPNLFLLLATMGCGLLYMANSVSKSQKEEITYMDFVSQYLTKNRVKMITVAQDKSNETFQYRAEILTHDDQKVYLVLPQIDNFLYKLDLVQREMGKQPTDFVPLKFASENQSSDSNSVFLNLLMLGMMGLFFYQIYKSRNPSNLKKGKDAGSKGPGGGMFGQGGMGDMFGMGKSNATVYGIDKKIKTKFRHVAGMENAKQEV